MHCRIITKGVLRMISETLMLVYCIQTDSEVCRANLCRCSLESAPGVKTTGETVGLVAFAHQAQFPWVLCILGPHMLNIDLTSFQAQFNLHLACLCTNPHVNLFSIVQKHDVIISQVILAEI